MVAQCRVIVVAACAAFVAVAACAKPTEVTLVVSSDVPCDALQGVSISAGPLAEVDTLPAAAVTSKCRPDGDGSRVGSLVIVPRDQNDAPLAVRVVAGVEKQVAECTLADGYRGCIVARRLLHFLPETNLTVVVTLRSACTSVPCDSAATCVAGACVAATLDPTRCRGAGCDETALGGGALPSDDAGAGTLDANLPTPDGSAPWTCAPNEKTCDARCVRQDDARFGCAPTGCLPCPGDAIATSACDRGACTVVSCGVGYKLCAGNCVPADPAHGCSVSTCTPCESTNGTPHCAANGTCTIDCNPGTKLCNGRCVRVDDPTYGCSPSGCGNQTCPNPGNGTLVCNGTECAIGTCSAGTKQCGNACVPTDANNGCEQANRCSACPAGNACQGSPTTCTCVPEPLAVTCATKSCGPAINNCGENVTCPDKCPNGTVCGTGASANSCLCVPDNAAACAGKICGPAVNNCGETITCPSQCPADTPCGTGGAGSNACCVPDDAAACAGKACGPATNNCGKQITCPNTCTGYNTCGGGSGGPNACGCKPRTKAEACEEPCGRAYNGCGGYITCGPRICP